jgi:hypothetical protein
MSGLLLSDDERRRFGDYCAREANDYRGMVEQMVKAGMPEAIMMRSKILAGAFGVVANHIRSAESFTVGSDE